MRPTTKISVLLKVWRQGKGWNQTVAARQIGIAQTTLSDWERGAIAVDAKHWPAIRDAFNLNRRQTRELQGALLEQHSVAA